MRKLTVALLSSLLALPTLALADDGQPIGSYLTSANTSSDLPDVNTRLPKQWVVFTTLGFNGTGTKTNTVNSSGGSSSALTINVVNNGTAIMYVYAQETGDSAPTPLPGFSMTGTFSFGGAAANTTTSYSMLSPLPGNVTETFNSASTDIYLYVTTASSGTYSTLFTPCQSSQYYNVSKQYLDVTGFSSAVTLTLSNSTCSVSVS